VSTESELLRVLLAGIAAYHLAIGTVALLSERWTAVVVRRLYGAALDGSPQFRYAVRMLGIYALAFGFLLSIAARDPQAHRPIVLAAAFLLGARALTRMVLAKSIAAGFGVSARRNRAHACGLLLVAIALVCWLLT
jgi:hypothetical protein